jgi:hypothetical protein
MKMWMCRWLSAVLAAGALLAPSRVDAQIVPTGTIDAVDEPVQLLTGGIGLPTGGWATVGVQLTGTWTGTLEFQVSIDLENYQTVNCLAPDETVTVTGSSANGIWDCPTAGKNAIRVISSGWSTGEVEVFLRGSPAGGASSVAAAASFDGVLQDAPGGDAVTQAGADALRVMLVDSTGSEVVNDDLPYDGVLKDAAGGDAITNTTANSLRVTVYDASGNAISTSSAGAGVIDSTTTRVVTSTDDPLHTGSQGNPVVSAASNNATLLNNQAGRLMGVYLVNTTSTIYYIRFYNLATSPTCSSATGFTFSLAIPASTSGAGFAFSFGTKGIAFGTGLGYCITGGPTSTDNTNAAVGIYGVITEQ